MDLVSLKPLGWLICLIPLGIVVHYSLVDRPQRRKYVAMALRVAAIVLLVLALCRPFMSFASHDVHIAFVLDVSESVDLASARAALDQIDQYIGQLKPSDSWSCFMAADGVRHVTDIKAAAAELDTWLQSMPDNAFRRATKLTHALLTARLCFPANKGRRLVVFTDGRPTGQQVDEALVSLEKEQIDLRLQRLPGLKEAEACIASIKPSTTKAFEGEIVRMTAKLRANQRMPAVLRILNRAVVVSQQDLVLQADQDNTVNLEVPMHSSGATHWTAELIPEQDYFLVNNRATCTVSVGGKPRILVLHESPRRMRSFRKAMAEQGLDIDLRGEHGMPDTLAELLAFDALVLADISATELSLPQMQLLKRYVIDFGGGLAMFGSNNSFGLGGYYNTPVEEVLPLTSRYEKEKEQPSVAMVLVIDKSGSMQGMPIELARQAAKATVDLMGKQDQIGVVGFDGQAFVVSPMRSVTEATAVKDAINTLASGGGTSMYPGVDTAFRMLQDVSAKIKHVIILSDGRSKPADHQGLVADMAVAGMTVSTVALGQADRELLASLAEIGKGRYYETADPTNIPQIFTKETIETSRTAVKEDVFNLLQTSDHTLLAGFSDSDLPVVFGYVMANVKPATQLLLVAHSGDPVMAVSRHGLGTALAYTSDVTDKWGSQWLTWNQFGRFWSQALRSIVRRESTEGLYVEQTQDSRRWTINVTRQDEAGRPVSGIDFDAQTVDDTEAINQLAVDEVGLGRYSMKVPIGEASSLSLRLHDRDFDKTAVLHFNRPYPAEYGLARQMAPALQGLADLESELIREGIPPLRTRRPIGHICYLLALVAMVTGLLFRRI